MNGNSARFALALFLKGKNMRMKWIGLLWMALLMVGCGSNDQKETSETEGSSAFQEFLQYFPEKQLPYELGDTSLKSGGKDLPAEIERLRAANIHFRNDIATGPGGSEVLLDDPSGNPIELFQPAGQSAKSARE